MTKKALKACSLSMIVKKCHFWLPLSLLLTQAIFRTGINFTLEHKCHLSCTPCTFCKVSVMNPSLQVKSKCICNRVVLKPYIASQYITAFTLQSIWWAFFFPPSKLHVFSQCYKVQNLGRASSYYLHTHCIFHCLPQCCNLIPLIVDAFLFLKIMHVLYQDKP